MDLSALKAIFALGTLCVCLIAGCLPLALFQTKKISWQSSQAFKVIRGLLAVSLGVFLGICFVGLFPSVQETQLELEKLFNKPLHYPMAEVCILAGYFLFWLAAELCKLYFEGQSGEPEETLSLQEGAPAPNYNSLTSCHDVGPGTGTGIVSVFDLILIIISLSIKSVLESVAIGSLVDRVIIVQMGCAKMVHETICTLVMALNLVNVLRDSPSYYSYIAIVLFALMNASGFGIGIALGSALTRAAVVAKFILKALAGGAMMVVVMTLFVNLNQVLKPHDIRAGLKFTCVLLGFFIFAMVRAIHSLVGGQMRHDGMPRMANDTLTPSQV